MCPCLLFSNGTVAYCSTSHFNYSATKKTVLMIMVCPMINELINDNAAYRFHDIRAYATEGRTEGLYSIFLRILNLFYSMTKNNNKVAFIQWRPL